MKICAKTSMKVYIYILYIYIYIYFFFHVHKHPWFGLFTYRHTCVDQGSCGAVFEPIFLENLRRLVESPMGVFVDGTKLVQHSWKPTRMMCHVAFGSRYQLDDTGT